MPDYDATRLWFIAWKTKDAPQARPLLALAAIYDGANPDLLLKQHEKPVLNPFVSSGQVTMALLDELVDTAAISSPSI